MKVLLSFFLILTSVLFSSVAVAQVEDDPDGALEEEESFEHITYSRKKGLMYGLNVGLSLPNNESGLFYNGTAPNDIGIYLTNPNVITEISELVGGYNFTLVELPEEMRYKAATSFGLNLKYHFDWSNALVFDVNYSQLNTTGKVVLELDREDPNSANAFLEFLDIWGKEDRMVTSIGYQYNFNTPSAAGSFIEFGPLLTTVKVRENSFSVGNRTYNILRPQTVNGNQFLNNRQPSVTDLGMYAALGVNFEFDKFTVDVIGRGSYEKVQFQPEVETKHKLHFYPNIRFSYRIIK